MSLNGLRMGGQYRSKPPSFGEKVFGVVLVVTLLALAFSPVGYVAWLIYRGLS